MNQREPTEMETRVAEAGYEAMIRRHATAIDINPEDAMHRWANQSEALRADWIACAGVMIRAMRKTTLDQYDALAATEKKWRDLNSEIVWTTYIDAASPPVTP